MYITHILHGRRGGGRGAMHRAFGASPTLAGEYLLSSRAPRTPRPLRLGRRVVVENKTSTLWLLQPGLELTFRRSLVGSRQFPASVGGEGRQNWHGRPNLPTGTRMSTPIPASPNESFRGKDTLTPYQANTHHHHHKGAHADPLSTRRESPIPDSDGDQRAFLRRPQILTGHAQRELTAPTAAAHGRRHLARVLCTVSMCMPVCV